MLIPTLTTPVAPHQWLDTINQIINSVNSNFSQIQAPDTQYTANTATAGATLTAASVGASGVSDVTVDMTGTLGAGAALTLPTVANLLKVLPNAQNGASYRLRIINDSSANFAWTVTTNTGWTLGGTMTVAQSTWRDFYVTITSVASATATLQGIGTGTQS